METKKQQELRAVEFKDGILWLEDLVEDCLDFSNKDTVLVRDNLHQLLMISTKENIATAEFQDLNQRQVTEGIIFDIIFYESTECIKDCKFKDSVFPVSFAVKCNSKRYQMSCSKSNNIEFLEQNTPEDEIVDGSKRNIIFHMENYMGQFSRFESEVARDHWLCTEFVNGLYKLALKKVQVDNDEGTLLEVSSCSPN
ncbi:uncharacterized protein [Heterodontus francisci]|uniref:uncharacterized protein isoform X2 n=1 Tax=Heterodontus francisci TaxID=7792 RepID=UPI00355B0032